MSKCVKLLKNNFKKIMKLFSTSAFISKFCVYLTFHIDFHHLFFEFYFLFLIFYFTFLFFFNNYFAKKSHLSQIKKQKIQSRILEVNFYY